MKQISARGKALLEKLVNLSERCGTHFGRSGTTGGYDGERQKAELDLISYVNQLEEFAEECAAHRDKCVKIDFSSHAMDVLAKLFPPQTVYSGYDRKYGCVRVDNKSFHPGEPLFILRAKDLEAVRTVDYYHLRCKAAGCKGDHLEGVIASAQLMEKWQNEHEDLLKRAD